jgi:hypothetical protein
MSGTPGFLLPSPMPKAVQWNFHANLPGLEGLPGNVATIMVTGSREFTDLKAVNDTLKDYADVFADKHPDATLVLISGHANRGADVLAEMAFTDYGPVFTLPAQWDDHSHGRCKCAEDAEYCKLAGIIRNEQMVDVYKPSVCVAFYSPTAENRGTNHASEYATSKGVPVRSIIERPVLTQPAPLEVPASSEPQATTDPGEFAKASTK